MTIITRSMTAKQNQDASRRKRPKTVDDDDGDSGSWSYLIHDILISIISRLGVIDFVSFSCVCKSWRTVALSNRKMFMLSREPMKLCISTEVAKRKECYLEDSEGRKFKSFLPHSSDTICLGLVSGYLIFYGRKTHDFKLVNPITRHELHFPRFDFHEHPDPEKFRCTLVFSSTMSKWVFVASIRCSRDVSFSFSSERANWIHLSTDFPIIDLHFFKGKIYALSDDIRLCEVRLSPTPTLTLLKMKNLMDPKVIHPEFATWGEKLYVVGLTVGSYVPFETEFEQMRWVKPTQALKEDAWFVKIFKFHSTKLELWMDPREQYERFSTYKNYINRILFPEDMWYCPHKCLDVNLLHDQRVIE